MRDMLSAFFLDKTIVFVGCGSGLEDPNFSTLLNWAAGRHQNILNRHCLLLLQDDALNCPPLLRLRYGKSYASLVPFLRRLFQAPPQSPTKVSLDLIPAQDTGTRQPADPNDHRTPPEPQETPLHVAVLRGDEAMVRSLLNAGVDKDARDSLGNTLLHIAAREGNEAVVCTLSDAGADRSARGRNGQTPLHEAAVSGHEPTVRTLLDAGLAKDARDEAGWTPLHIATWSQTIARILLKAGADKDARNNRGWTPLHIAARIGDEAIVRILLKAGADKAARDEAGETPLQKSVYSETMVRLLRGNKA